MRTRDLRFLLVVSCSSALGAQTSSATEFHIPAGDLGNALRVLTQQSGVEAIYAADQVKGVYTRGVQGDLSPEQAVKKLLEGSHLVVHTDPSGAMLIAAADTKRVEPAEQPAESTPRRSEAEPGPAAIHLEEIIVTARKREESLQTVPVAVTAVSAEALANNLANDLTKMAELVPQVSVGQGGAGTGAVLTVRGISTATSDSGLDQSVAVEIDGVPLSRGSVISASLYDVGSLQVLQGPQALFFGKNSPAGVISLRSADPTDHLEGYVRVGNEFEADQRYIESAISGPLTSNLKARLAMRASEMDGWIRNVAEPIADPIVAGVIDPGANWGRKGPASEDYGGRLTLLWTPGDDFEAKLKVEMKSQKQNAGNANSEPFCINGQTVPVRAGNPIPGADCKKNRVKSHGGVAPQFVANVPYTNNGVPYAESNFTLASLALNKDFGAFTLTSTTGYFDSEYQQLQVSDWTPYATIWSANHEDYTLVTEELRANTQFDGPVNFAGGIYYEDFSRPYFNASDVNHVFNPVAQNYATIVKDSKTKGDYFSVFGQIRWNILPNLELAGGARYSRDKKTMRVVNLETGPAQPTLYPRGVPLKSKYKDEDVSPELTLSWRPREEQTLYAAYKTGYKAGGISNPLQLFQTATPENLQFEPEETEGFEAGYKATLLNRTLRLDLVGYRYTYDNLQVSSYNAQTISFVMQNAASARIKGLQGSAEWLALEGLTLRGSFGYNIAKYLDFPNAQCYSGQTAELGCVNRQQDLSGKRLLRAPKYTFSLGADYTMHFAAGWDTTFSVQGSRTSSYMASTDYGPGGYQDGYWLLNASVRTGPSDGRFELALLGRNLTNSYYMLQTFGWSGSGNVNQYVGFFNRPREVALQGTVRF